MDGKAAAAKTVARKRAVLYNAVEYAVELKLLGVNRIREVKWTAPKEVKAIDKRVVISPQHARLLLPAVGAQRELLLSETAPTAGAAWTDSGQRRDRRQLKQRGRGEVRVVPFPPPLTELLHAHLEAFGTASDGRLFRSLTGGELAESTVARVWSKTREAALTKQEFASPLGPRPYALRHACVSTWLSGGVPSTQVAEWAGHSVAVLHQIYAKVIAGMEASSRERIERALGLPTLDETANRPQKADDGPTQPDTAG